MIKVRSGVLTFAISAAAVVVISVALQARRNAMQAAAVVPRFSGSSIVAELPSLLAPARLPTRLRVSIVRDSAAASYYNSPATLDSIVEAWRVELTAIGADVRVARSNALGNARAAHVLVIPSSPCMTVATREAIEAATSRGQGLIITGLAGVYDAGCRRIGYGLLVSVTGASRVATLEPRSMVYVVLPAGTPLGADIPPGARIELNPARQVALRHRGRDAYYADYALQPQPADSMPLLDGAIAHRTNGKARIVYWGFDLNNVNSRAWNRSVVRLLIRNSVAWAGRTQLAFVEPWPHGQRAAAAFAQDVEYAFQNVRYAADSLRAIGVPATYFLTSKYATHYKRRTRELAAVGEIASHTENHELLGGVAPDIQKARLQKTQRHLRKFVDGPVAGLRPPEEQCDVATMAAWLAAGGTYLFGVNDRRAAAPELLRIGDDTLLLLSRVVDDDVALTAPGQLPHEFNVERKFIHDFAQVRALGGLYVLSYHSQLLARPEFVPVVARVARVVAADSTIWIATTGDIAKWWRARSLLSVETRTTNDALRVVVHNRSEDSVANAVVRVVLANTRRVLGANARMLTSDAGTLRLALPVIPAAGTRVVTIKFEPRAPMPRAERERPTWRRPAPRKAPWWQFWKHL
ncbi:MAG TPA: polysaccharide deacetylase family protein [Longimicrobiales bacterium]